MKPAKQVSSTVAFEQGHYRFLPDRVESDVQGLFDPQNPGLDAQPVSVGGRQAAWFISGAFGQAVLRHYRRGGLVARFNRDRYWWAGSRRSRSFAEFDLLLFLHRHGLRVPLPLAAACWRAGLMYRAAILVERIPGARTLFQELDNGRHEAVAQAILDMHEAGVFHADLNVYNILFDDRQQVWLIDFDRSKRVQIGNRHRQSNLLRLRRSLMKTAGQKGLAYWHELNRAYSGLLALKNHQ